MADPAFHGATASSCAARKRLVRSLAGVLRSGTPEPLWRRRLSNKWIQPVLWEIAPRDYNLLPADFADDAAAKRMQDGIANKLICSRVEANMTLVLGGGVR